MIVVLLRLLIVAVAEVSELIVDVDVVSSEIVPDATVRSEIVVVARVVSADVAVSELVTIRSDAVSDVMNAVTPLKSVAKRLDEVADEAKKLVAVALSNIDDEALS